MNKQRIILALTLLFACSASIYAQDSISVSVRANVTKNAVQLRWAVNSSSAWSYTNQNGMMIERLTIVRNGVVLDTPEEVRLTSEPIKPRPLDDWQHIAQTDDFAALIAQALYGDDFEVSSGEAGVGQLIAISQQQEQRYALSLYAADMSYPAALMAGWGFTDNTVVAGERYLYRVTPISPQPDKVIESGVVYTGLDDYEPLPRPFGLTSVFGNSSVLLTWDYTLLLSYYNAYYVERSDDNRTFNRLSSLPLTNIGDADRIFFTDTIPNNKTFYYRVVGLTPFGETSEPSDTIQGMAVPMLIYVPHINLVEPDDKGGVYVSWEFPEEGNGDITHFELQRSDTDKEPFKAVVENITPDARQCYYAKPQADNYLRIAAVPPSGGPTYSFPRMLQMVDSIPPAMPQGLEVIVDTTGIAHLTWQANTDEDIYGYRIFRAQTKGEELIPLTDVAVKNTFYQDSISVHNLNAKVYYAISALDKRYNQSALCPTVEVTKPVMIIPASPVINKYEATEAGVRLTWVTNRDETLQSFIIRRGEASADEMQTIHTQSATDNREYLDEDILAGMTYRYEIIAINSGQKQSEPSPFVSVRAKANVSGKAEAIGKFTASRNSNGITLKWEHGVKDVKSARMYRKEGEETMMLWKEFSVWDKEITDNTAKQNTSYEYLLVLKDTSGRNVTKNVKIN